MLWVTGLCVVMDSCQLSPTPGLCPDLGKPKPRVQPPRERLEAETFTASTTSEHRTRGDACVLPEHTAHGSNRRWAMARTELLLTSCYCVDEATAQPASQAVGRKLKIWLPAVPPDAFLRGGNNCHIVCCHLPLDCLQSLILYSEAQVGWRTMHVIIFRSGSSWEWLPSFWAAKQD